MRDVEQLGAGRSRQGQQRQKLSDRSQDTKAATGLKCCLFSVTNTQIAQIQKIKQSNTNTYLQSGLKSYHCCSQQTNTYTSHIYTYHRIWRHWSLISPNLQKRITLQVRGWDSWVIVVEDKGLEKSSASPPSHQLKPPHSPHSPTQISQL